MEHDYIGLSEPSLLELERSSDKISSSPSSSTSSSSSANVNLKETELRLGLPGSESPERTINGYNQTPLKNFVSGAKRGFSDTIYGSEKWDFSINGGSCLNLSKGDNLVSPKSNSLRTAVKEGLVSAATKPAEEEKKSCSALASKAQVVGWPPIRSFRKNTLATNLSKKTDTEEKSRSGCLYVKVSMDGAPYLRKVDLKTYCNYAEFSSALEKMFSCFTIGQCTSNGISGQEGLSESHLMDLLHGSEYVLTYEDKDGDWMLVGDVPWGMFMDSCKRLRIMRSTDAIGLAPRSTQKCKNQN